MSELKLQKCVYGCIQDFAEMRYFLLIMPKRTLLLIPNINNKVYDPKYLEMVPLFDHGCIIVFTRQGLVIKSTFLSVCGLSS